MMDLSFCRLFHTSQGHPGRVGAWINFEHHWLHGALLHTPIFEPDGEWLETMHYRSLVGEQDACAAWCAGHKWLLVFVQDKNH